MNNIDEHRIELAKKYFAEYKKSGKNILKALNLCLPEINNLIENGIKNREQIAILESMFDTTINYETYRQFVYKKSKKVSKKVAPKELENEIKKTPKAADKVVTKVQEIDTKKVPKINKKVTPREFKKEVDPVKSLNKEFVRLTKPEFTNEDF